MTTVNASLSNEELASLSNEELRERLQDYGVNVGPIVSSTRLFYEKKLGKLIDSGSNPPSQSQSEESEDNWGKMDIDCIYEEIIPHTINEEKPALPGGIDMETNTDLDANKVTVCTMSVTDAAVTDDEDWLDCSSEEDLSRNDSGAESSSGDYDDGSHKDEAQSDDEKSGLPSHRNLFDSVLWAFGSMPFAPDNIQQIQMSQCIFEERNLSKDDQQKMLESITEVLHKDTVSRLSKCNVYSLIVSDCQNLFRDRKFAVFVHYVHNRSCTAEFLCYIDCRSWTADVVASGILSTCEKFCIDPLKVVAVVSDGAPLFWKSENNVVSILKEKMPNMVSLHTDVEHVTNLVRNAAADDDFLSLYCQLLPVMFEHISLENNYRGISDINAVIDHYLDVSESFHSVCWEGCYWGLKGLMLSYNAIVSLLKWHGFHIDDDIADALTCTHQELHSDDTSVDATDLQSLISEYTVPAFSAVFLDILEILREIQLAFDEMKEYGPSLLKEHVEIAKTKLEELKTRHGNNYAAFLENLDAKNGNIYYKDVELLEPSLAEIVDVKRLKLIDAVIDCISKQFPEETLKVFEALSVIDHTQLLNLPEEVFDSHLDTLSKHFGKLFDKHEYKKEVADDFVSDVTDFYQEVGSTFTRFTSMWSKYPTRCPATAMLGEIALCLPLHCSKPGFVHKFRCDSLKEPYRVFTAEDLTMRLRLATCRDIYKEWEHFPADEAFKLWESKMFATDDDLQAWLALNPETESDDDDNMGFVAYMVV